MKFLIQHNLINAQSLEKIRTATSHLPVVYIGAIPYTELIESNELIEGQDYIPYGSTLLSRVGAKRGWKGLHYDLSKLNYSNFVANRNDMANDNILKAKDAYEYLLTRGDTEEFFTRPSLDNKQYSGCVMEAKELREWLKSMMESGPGTYYMHPDTEIVLSSPKTIQAEWRWFIVGGKVISGSMYRAHDQMNLQRELDTAVITEAQAMADKWLPCDCVVMDTALINNEMKVLEFNCINSSGFYDNDIKSVFESLYSYHTR